MPNLTAPSSHCLSLNNALLDRVDLHAAGAKELNRRIDLLLGAAEEHRHDADLVLHARLADVEGDLRILARHLPDNRLLDLSAGGKGEPATFGIGGIGH